MKNETKAYSNSTFNKVLSIIISIAMVATLMIPLPAFADEEAVNEQPVAAEVENVAADEPAAEDEPAVDEQATVEEPAPAASEEEAEDEAAPAADEADEAAAPADENAAAENEAEAEADEPAASNVHIAESATVGDFTVDGDEGSYEFNERKGILTILGDVTISTTTQTNQNIVIAKDAKVSLDGVDIASKNKTAGITVAAGVNAVIELLAGTVNKVAGDEHYAGIEVSWAGDGDYGHLTIQGEGELEATGGKDSAGIGGSRNAGTLYGDITIDSGNIKAYGNAGGAGIGSGATNAGSNKPSGTDWGTITINNGDIFALGSNSAGIGGGNHVDSGEVIINNGNITALGASGIGTGTGGSKGSIADGADPGPGGVFADITINGGTILAAAIGTDNWGGAGIGGGAYSDADVTINGGTIEAYGGNAGSGHNSLHHGGAAIGGGYEGHANIAINGGEITAYVGANSAAAAIGSGATPNSNESRGTNGRDNREGAGTHLTSTTVDITDGTVNAYANEHYSINYEINDGIVNIVKTKVEGENVDRGGAGIGGGVSADKVSVSISGGNVIAYGAASDSDKMQGGAGIGSGLQGTKENIPGTNKNENAKYHADTNLDVTITGGNVVAVGGWGAAGIGSGAKNVTASSIVIDATEASVQAYADGTKYAVDIPAGDDVSNTNVTGNVLQGTFVHKYTDSQGNEQGTEGLQQIILKNDETGETKTLTLMPEGYRSYATDVADAGIYSIYTNSDTIGATGNDENGEGAHFSVYPTDQWNGDEQGENNAAYGVTEDALSNYNYLFPVKTLVVDKEIAGSVAADVNGTFYFAVSKDGEIIAKADGTPWIESITVENGEAKGSAYFANMNDGAYEIWEVDENGTRLVEGTEFGNMVLAGIATRTSTGSNNNVSLDEGTWTDFLTVINTFAPVDDPDTPVNPDTPEDPNTPVEPVAPTTPADDPAIPAGTATVAAAGAAPAAPTAVTTIEEAVAPLTDGPVSEDITDDATPLNAYEHEDCWVHWWIILGIMLTGAYSAAVLGRRGYNSRKLKNIDNNILNGTGSNERSESASHTAQPAMSASKEA